MCLVIYLQLNDNISSKNTIRQKQILDSAQTVFEKKTQSVYKRNISRITQSPGGVEQFVANEYCKALAACYDPHTEFFPLTEEGKFRKRIGQSAISFWLCNKRR